MENKQCERSSFSTTRDAVLNRLARTPYASMSFTIGTYWRHAKTSLSNHVEKHAWSLSVLAAYAASTGGMQKSLLVIDR